MSNPPRQGFCRFLRTIPPYLPRKRERRAVSAALQAQALAAIMVFWYTPSSANWPARWTAGFHSRSGRRITQQE